MADNVFDLKRKSINIMEIENQLISWFNDIGLSERDTKIELLLKVNEILINQLSQLLPQYLDNVLAYCSDRNQDVRKITVSFMEGVSKKRPDLIPRLVGPLYALLQDISVQVQKKVIQGAAVIYKNTLIWFTKVVDCTPAMRNAWEQLGAMKVQILNMVDSENEGIQTNSIKFLNSIIVLQTTPDESAKKKNEDFSIDDISPNLMFLNGKKLEEESSHIFNLLVKFHNSQHISSNNLKVCVNVLCSIGKSRPKFILRSIQALADLINSLPPSFTQSQVSSIKKHIKMELGNLIKHPSSIDVQPHLLQLLLDLGMTQQEIVKLVPRERRNKRLYDLKSSDILSKRMRLDSPQSNSQSSDKSDLSSQPDVSDDGELKVPIVREKVLFESLQSVNNIVELVMATMINLPDEIPDDFPRNYKPISNAGTTIQIKSLAKLLLAHIHGDYESLAEEKTAIKIPLLKDDDEVTLKNAIAKLAHTEKTNKQMDSAVSKLMEETRREDKKRYDEVKEKLIPPPTPTIPKLKQRVKLLKLQEITKAVPKSMKEKLMFMAVERILKCDRESFISGVAHYRNKLLVTLASTYNTQIREAVLEYILDDIVPRFEIGLYWLYEEYSYVQGFNRQPLNLSPLKANERADTNYNNLLCALITNVSENLDPSQEAVRESLMRRIYLEAPMITDDAVEYLRHIAANESSAILSLTLLEDMIVKRPPKCSKYVTPILLHTANEISLVRETALSCIFRIYQRTEMESIKRSIEKHATLYLSFLAMPEPPVDLFSQIEGRSRVNSWNDELYKICLNLYLTLLPTNEDMIMELAVQYANIGADAKRCVLRALETPIRKAAFGMNSGDSWGQSSNVSPVFLKLIEECPKGSETLITRIVHILTERAPPGPELVSRVRELYSTRVSDVRFLIPVLNGLTKQEILAALPKLIKLNPIVMREVFNKLLGLQANLDEFHTLPVSPTELLIALHLIDQSKAELKYIIKATSLCFAEKQAYTQEVLAMVIQGLMEQPEIPVLLMRTVLQALTLYPKLSGFVLNVLQRLIAKEVWHNKVAWEGWIRCCERLLPASLAALASLPAQTLQAALAMSGPLASAVSQPPAGARLPHPSVLYLQANLPSIMPEYPTVHNDNLASVPRADQGIAFDPLNEPLPPGMD